METPPSPDHFSVAPTAVQSPKKKKILLYQENCKIMGKKKRDINTRFSFSRQTMQEKSSSHNLYETPSIKFYNTLYFSYKTFSLCDDQFNGQNFITVCDQYRYVTNLLIHISIDLTSSSVFHLTDI